MPGTSSLNAAEQRRRDALGERLFEASRAALAVYNVYIGDRLGLYRALAGRGPTTPEELADAAGIHPRYAREWLEQQAVSEILEHDDGRFVLPDGHAEALVDRDSLAHAAPMARAAVSVAAPCRS